MNLYLKISILQYMCQRVKRNYFCKRVIVSTTIWLEAINLIGQIHFDRENDNYLKRIEYLSSMIILSKCDAVVAGNCRGTHFAVLNSETVKNRYVFDKGYYE